MTTRLTRILAVLALLTTSAALAQDLRPSWRGQPGSTYREWRFDSSANPAPPELNTAPSHGAKASVVAGRFSVGWTLQVPGMGNEQSGIWDLGRNGTITMMLTNGGTSASYQRISVQVSQWLDGGIYAEPATVSIPGASPAGENTGLMAIASVGGWYVDQTEWLVPEGVAVDRIVITGANNGTVVDRVGVDTLAAGAEPSVALSIRPLDGTQRVEISWTSTESYSLEGTFNLTEASTWVPVEATVQTNGDFHWVIIDAAATARFFRLTQN